MPLTLGATLVAIVSMSGLPPLAGFGGKWLLLTAMVQKGWYGPAIMTLLATFVGFIYMARFVHTIFFGPRKAQLDSLAEAPIALLVAQYLLAAGILAMSFFPKLFIEPVSAAIDPQFASTLVWQGMSLEMIYGTWNPAPVMALAVAASAVLFAVFWLIRRLGWPEALSANIGFFEACRRVSAILTPPIASEFWAGLVQAVDAIAGRVRLLYTGDEQTYALYILYYVLIVYALGGGLHRLWASG
jgi:NADH:ubiquinone oxidoreductase subunit 5 (subunit L)/multisubunit Na+/H+ antiporter MnhA subunit